MVPEGLAALARPAGTVALVILAVMVVAIETAVELAAAAAERAALLRRALRDLRARMAAGRRAAMVALVERAVQ